MFEELKEKAKLLYGELEGYVHSTCNYEVLTKLTRLLI